MIILHGFVEGVEQPMRCAVDPKEVQFFAEHIDPPNSTMIYFRNDDESVHVKEPFEFVLQAINEGKK